jgi:hypothetical protein
MMRARGSAGAVRPLAVGPLKAAGYSAWGASPRSPAGRSQERPEGAQEAPAGRPTKARRVNATARTGREPRRIRAG